jgi:two-component system, OmpR family, sensor histidine kinase CpxA
MKTRRLFWKMFISFWIAQTAFFIYLGFRTHQLTRSAGPLWLVSAQRTLPVVASSAVEHYTSGGIPAASQYLTTMSDGSRIRMWLVDPAGMDVTGTPLPQDVAEAVRNTRNSPEATVRVNTEQTLVSSRAAGSRGAYTLVAKYNTVPLLRGEGLFRLFAISTILASIACFLLAHYLSAPIWQLRLATRRLASGDLEARAGDKVGRRNDEIGDLVRDFDTMAETIRDLLENQKRLLSDISHELRSPLARLRVALALARRREDDTQRSSHERIEREVERLDEMIGRILMLSRLESGEMTLSTSDLDLNELVEDVVADARYEAERTGHSIQFVADAHFHANANEELLRSSIENVLRNALYYTSGDEPIDVQLCPGPDGAVLRIRDNGPGVPAEALADLFRPFYRVDDSRVSRTGGTGLGLAIAQRAILAHRGSITATNAVPHGLIVEIKLPATKVPIANEVGAVGPVRS